MKDRLAELQATTVVKKKVRRANSEEEENTSETSKLLTDGQWQDMDRFFSEMEKINNEVNALDEIYKKIRTQHSKLLTQPPSSVLTKELNDMNTTFAATVRRVKGMIDTLEKSVLTIDNDTAESRIRRDQLATTKRRFVGVGHRMVNEQLEYKEKSKKKYQDYLRVVGTDLPDDVIEDAIEKGNLQEHVKGIILCHDQKKALYEDVKSRTEDLVALERSIKELGEMFHDLHLLVCSQGEILDNIEMNVLRSVEYSEKARADIVSAKKNRERARYIKIGLICLIIFLIFFLFFGGMMMFCFYMPFICRA